MYVLHESLVWIFLRKALLFRLKKKKKDWLATFLFLLLDSTTREESLPYGRSTQFPVRHRKPIHSSLRSRCTRRIFSSNIHGSSIVCTRSFIGSSRGNSRTSSRQVIALSSNSRGGFGKKEILFFIILIGQYRFVKLLSFVFRYLFLRMNVRGTFFLEFGSFSRKERFVG